MARAQDPFLVFQEEAIGWWDEPAPEPRRPPRPRRPPPRTLAGDLARLQRRLSAESQGPLLLGAAIGLLLLMALAYVVLGRDAGPSAPVQAEPPPVTAPTPAAAAAVPVAPSDPTLRSGDRGVAVRDLQHALAALGYSTATT